MSDNLLMLFNTMNSIELIGPIPITNSKPNLVTRRSLQPQRFSWSDATMSNVKLKRSYSRLAGWYGLGRKADISFPPGLFLLLEMRSIFSACSSTRVRVVGPKACRFHCVRNFRNSDILCQYLSILFHSYSAGTPKSTDNRPILVPSRVEVRSRIEK